VEKGTARWRERRAARLRELAPAWAARGAGAAAERLVTQAVAGNAWRGPPQRCAPRAPPGPVSAPRCARCGPAPRAGAACSATPSPANGAGLRRVLSFYAHHLALHEHSTSNWRLKPLTVG